MTTVSPIGAELKNNQTQISHFLVGFFLRFLQTSECFLSNTTNNMHILASGTEQQAVYSGHTFHPKVKMLPSSPNRLLRECLLRETDLSLQKCIQIGRAAELSRQRAKVINVQGPVAVHVVTQKERLRGRGDPTEGQSIIQCRYCGWTREKKGKMPCIWTKMQILWKKQSLLYSLQKCRDQQEKQSPGNGKCVS